MALIGVLLLIFLLQRFERHNHQVYLQATIDSLHLSSLFFVTEHQVFSSAPNEGSTTHTKKTITFPWIFQPFFSGSSTRIHFARWCDIIPALGTTVGGAIHLRKYYIFSRNTTSS